MKARRNGQRQYSDRRTRRLPYSVRRLIPTLIALAAVASFPFIDDVRAGVQSLFGRVAVAQPQAAGKILEGRASVVDGDTIEIHGQRVRFNGIDAPEGKQSCKDAKGKPYACGRVAARALDEFLAASKPTRCTFVEWDKYGRFVGNCARADGRSVQSWLVENGHALDWPRYSHGAYAPQEARARNAKLGIWQGEFQKPWEWRAASGGETTATEAAPSPSVSLLGSTGCKIKGNISSKGERIYHLPGQENYDRTRISERKGERWFCTEAEATAAGWRRAKR